MKSHIIFSALLLTSTAVTAQRNFSMGQDFLDLALSKGGTTGGLSAFQTYRSTDIDGSQFFLPEWSRGEVVTTHREAFNTEFEFLYDKVRQELFIKQKDSSLVLLTNKDEVQSFTLKDAGKEYYFVNSKLFTDAKPQVFYQVLLYDSTKLSLFKYYKTSLVYADLSNMVNQRQGKVYDAFVDKFIYYIVKTGIEPVPFQLKNKSIRKAFNDIGVVAEKFLDEHTGIMDEKFLLDMVSSMNRNMDPSRKK